MYRACGSVEQRSGGGDPPPRRGRGSRPFPRLHSVSDPLGSDDAPLPKPLRNGPNPTESAAAESASTPLLEPN